MTPTPTLIRRRVAALLAAETATDDGPVWPTPAGPRAWPSHALPLGHKDLPALLIYTKGEDAMGDDATDDDLRPRSLSLEVQAYHQAADPGAVDDMLDTLAEAARLTVLAQPTLGAHPEADGLTLARRVIYRGWDRANERDGEAFAGAVRLRFDVLYYQPPADPGELADFLRFHADYDPAPADGTVAARDDVNMRP